MQANRRQILRSASASALTALFGASWLSELGFASPALADDDALDLGDLEALAALFELDAEPLLNALVDKLRTGESLKRLTAAGALANARTLGGDDYEGYHAFMGLVPALAIAKELPVQEAPLPVLKTLLRSAARMRAVGDSPLTACKPVAGDTRALVRERELVRAEQALAAAGSADQQWQTLTPIVRDDIEVHLVVFAWRAKEIVDLAGARHAHTAMRQILHFADGREMRRRRDGKPVPLVRATVAGLLEEHKLLDGRLGTRQPGDAFVSELAGTLLTGSRAAGAQAAAAALAAGIDPEAVAEALCLAGTRLILHDPGRREGEPGKPKGSVHGASIGVHASDSALAWRGIAQSVAGGERAATLIAGAFHTAGQGRHVSQEPYAYTDQVQEAAAVRPAQLGAALAEAVRSGDQERAGALAMALSTQGRDEECFSLLRPISVAQDGALHAEKYQHTARTVHAFARPEFRSEHLVAFARVVASQACQHAPEVEAARARLNS